MRALATPLRRPVGTAAAYAGLCLLGVTALQHLPIGLSPDLDLPALSVEVSWGTATPIQVESLVTSRIEEAVQGLRDVEEVTSVSGTGWASIGVAFDRDVDLDVAEVFLREQLAAIRGDLPDDVDAPRVRRRRPRQSEGGQFLVFQASGPFTPEVLRDILERRAMPRLTAIPGVSDAEIYGGAARELQIGLDPDAVSRGTVSVTDVNRVLGRTGGETTLGRTTLGTADAPVVLTNLPPRAADLRLAPVTTVNGVPIPLGRVARVSDAYAEPRRLSRLNGEPSIQVVLEREPGTNVMRVADRVHVELDALAGELPPSIELETLYDQSERVREELATLVDRSLISVVVIFLVMVVFQRSVRAPIVVLGSVLFSALLTFLLFRAAGIGINLVTLSGLALTFGMAVDSAIVILENISLRVRTGGNVLRTLAATREVIFPLLAATLTTAVVLVPFFYLSGDLRDYYLPFALAVCLSLAASMGVALTLTPRLARWGLGHRRSADGRTVRSFERVVAVTVRRPWVPVTCAFLLFGGSVWAFDAKVSRGSFFPPQQDTSLMVSVEFPPGAEIEQANALISEFETLALEHPYFDNGFVQQVETQVRERSAMVIVRFHPAVARTSAPEGLRSEMTARAAGVSGVSVSVFGKGPGYSSGGMNVSPSYQLVVEGPDYDTLDRLTENVADRLRRNGRVKNVDTHMSGMSTAGAVTLALVPHRDRIAEMDMTMRDVVDRVRPSIAGTLSDQVVRAPEGDLRTVVRLGDGEAIDAPRLAASLLHVGDRTFPATEAFAIEDRPVQSEIHRRNQQYTRTIGFEYRGPRKVGNRFVKALTENTTLPPGYKMREGLGIVLTSKDERAILGALALATLLVYMTSAALFESLLLPFAALLSVPISFVGIAAAFWATGESFDRTAYVGLILLAGIAINNALLLVHRAGSLLNRGRSPREAAVRAAAERARPILMTTATSVGALLPLAFGVDPGAVAGWRSLALAGAAGILTSAVVTLTVIPALIVLLETLRRSRPRELHTTPSLGDLSPAGL